jgi:RimJ/RimL family protein N-acetyltransferase
MNAHLAGHLVRLRPCERDDIDQRARWLAGPAASATGQRYPAGTSPLSWLGAPADVPSFASAQFAIETVFGRHIGDCSLRTTSPENRDARLGVTIGDAAHVDRGYGTDAARLLCCFGFETMGLHRISVEVFADDPRALRVYKRLGFRVEARRRDADFRNGRFRDALLFGLLHGELRNPMEANDELAG